MTLAKASIEDLEQGQEALAALSLLLTEGKFSGTKENALRLASAHNYIDALKAVNESLIAQQRGQDGKKTTAKRKSPKKTA